MHDVRSHRCARAWPALPGLARDGPGAGARRARQRKPRPTGRRPRPSLGRTASESRSTRRSITVEDGDGVVIRWGDKDTEIVRILGIDTPEVRRLEHNLPYDQPFGPEARAFAQGAFAAATEVELLRSPTLDPYGRTLAYLFINGRNYSVMAIKAGYTTETVSHYGDNGLPEEAAEVMAAAKDIGRLPFEPPHQYRARMRDLTNWMKQSGTISRQTERFATRRRPRWRSSGSRANASGWFRPTGRFTSKMPWSGSTTPRSPRRSSSTWASPAARKSSSSNRSRPSASGDFVWAIVDEKERHIGFIGLHEINWRNRWATGGLFIGERSAWGTRLCHRRRPRPHPVRLRRAGAAPDRGPHDEPGDEAGLTRSAAISTKASPGASSGATAAGTTPTCSRSSRRTGSDATATDSRP